MKNATPRVVHRCAITGRFCTRAHAEANPDTTIKHTIQPKREVQCES